MPRPEPRDGNPVLAAVIFIAGAAVFAYGCLYAPFYDISSMMSGDVVAWMVATAIGSAARLCFHCRTPHNYILVLYIVAWFAAINTSYYGGAISSAVAMVACCVETYILYIRNMNFFLRVFFFVLIAGVVAGYYALYMSGWVAAAVGAEYIIYCSHILFDTFCTYHGLVRRDAKEEEEQEENPLGWRPIHWGPIDWDVSVLAPLGAMYVVSMARFYMQEPDALPSWQLPELSTLLAGANVPEVEHFTWTTAALMSYLGKTDRKKHPRLTWAVIFTGAWLALLVKSQERIVGKNDELGFVVSCMVLVLVAVKISMDGPRVVDVHPAILTAASIGIWCSAQVLGDLVAPQAWLTLVVWPLGQHVLLVGLLALNSALPAKESQVHPSLASNEMSEITLC